MDVVCMQCFYMDGFSVGANIYQTLANVPIGIDLLLEISTGVDNNSGPTLVNVFFDGQTVMSRQLGTLSVPSQGFGTSSVTVRSTVANPSRFFESASEETKMWYRYKRITINVIQIF